jgi:uncharacterized protein YbcI
MFPHPDLLLVEMEDVFLTLERTMVERGQRDIVRQARQTFQSALRNEFIETVENLTGRQVENYESVTFTAPDRILEIFYLEPLAESAASAAPACVAWPAEGRVTRG